MGCTQCWIRMADMRHMRRSSQPGTASTVVASAAEARLREFRASGALGSADGTAGFLGSPLRGARAKCSWAINGRVIASIPRSACWRSCRSPQFTRTFGKWHSLLAANSAERQSLRSLYVMAMHAYHNERDKAKRAPLRSVNSAASGSTSPASSQTESEDELGSDGEEPGSSGELRALTARAPAPGATQPMPRRSFVVSQKPHQRQQRESDIESDSDEGYTTSESDRGLSPIEKTRMMSEASSKPPGLVSSPKAMVISTNGSGSVVSSAGRRKPHNNHSKSMPPY